MATAAAASKSRLVEVSTTCSLALASFAAARDAVRDVPSSTDNSQPSTTSADNPARRSLQIKGRTS